ncbi:hypothetical protein SCYAM73S_03936 [Streptomyces cyaneofuscatus]
MRGRVVPAVAVTANSPVFSPALSAGAVAVPSALLMTVTVFLPPSKRVPVVPVTVKVTGTLAIGAPRALRARTETRSSNVEPAVAVRGPVPAFSREPKVSAGDGGGVGRGGVGVGVGLVVPSPGLEGPGVGFVPPGLDGDGEGFGLVVPPGVGLVVPPGLGVGLGVGVLGAVGRTPLPSGTSCVPRW